ncbi:MAG: T9SS type A sorting domain-containing protein, partial [Ignavibacteria bacterium]|nr:T9SS type A sorting domain-containing protein [Ignavibacteria bacterium]
MKKLIIFVLFIYLVSSSFSQINNSSKGIISSYNGSDFFTYSNLLVVNDTLDFFPGTTFMSYWYYYSNTQNPISANLKVVPQVTWLSITPNIFTSNNCSHVIPVIFNFTVPQQLGNYNVSIVDSNGNYNTINLLMRVTNNPLRYRTDSLISMQSGQTVQRYEKVFWRGLNAAGWVPLGYCGPTTYIPGNQRTINYYKNPNVNWLTFNPANYTINLYDSIVVIKSFNPQPAGTYNVFECKHFQWLTYPRYVYWTVNVSTDIRKICGVIQENFSLYQNYPNPFNPNTTIRFDLPKKEFVKLKIYDLLGREVETLVNEQLDAGSYSVDWNASQYPSDVYLYVIAAGEFSDTKRMI